MSIRNKFDLETELESTIETLLKVCDHVRLANYNMIDFKKGKNKEWNLKTLDWHLGELKKITEKYLIEKYPTDK